MSDKSELIKKYDDEGLGKQELGKLRRLLLEELLHSLISDLKSVKKWLDKKETKFDTSKIAKAIGYETKPYNIRQSFRGLVKEYEAKLPEGTLKGAAKTNVQIRDETLIAFSAFVEERLIEPDYEWPRNLKGFLYRKGIWAYFLDIPPKEVTYIPSFFNNDSSMKTLLSNIDVKIAKGEVKSIDYEGESAIDEMSDNMTNYALTNLRNKLKAKKEEVMMLREELESIKLQLGQYKHKEELRLTGGKQAFKAGSIH